MRPMVHRTGLTRSSRVPRNALCITYEASRGVRPYGPKRERAHDRACRMTVCGHRKAHPVATLAVCTFEGGQYYQTLQIARLVPKKPSKWSICKFLLY